MSNISIAKLSFLFYGSYKTYFVYLLVLYLHKNNKMPRYHKLGKIPHKRHTNFRKEDGNIHYEELGLISIINKFTK